MNPNKSIKDELLRYTGSARHDPAVGKWLDQHPPELGTIARQWFARIRECGDDVRELMHDGFATACIEDVPFAYVGVFKAHANVGFFRGSQLPDPRRLLLGTGKRMRHVKVTPGEELNSEALSALIDAAYLDIKARLAHE
jgi:hypothetical protein